MEGAENGVQNSVQGTEKVAKKRRSESEKVGRLKYILEILKRIEAQLSSLDRRLGVIERA